MATPKEAQSPAQTYDAVIVGAPAYRARCDAVAAGGYTELKLE